MNQISTRYHTTMHMTQLKFIIFVGYVLVTCQLSIHFHNFPENFIPSENALKPLKTLDFQGFR